MSNYALQILTEALDKELIYNSQALCFIEGASHGASEKNFNSTTKAFRKSFELSEERIPQLRNAIDVLEKEFNEVI